MNIFIKLFLFHKLYIMNNYDITYELNDNNVKKSYVASVWDKNNSKLIKTFEYYLLGNFSKIKNVWVWSDTSSHTDLIVRSKTKELRKTLKYMGDTEIKTFVKHDTLVMSTHQFDEYMNTISKLVNKHYIFDENDDIITVLLIDKILINNE